MRCQEDPRDRDDERVKYSCMYVAVLVHVRCSTMLSSLCAVLVHDVASRGGPHNRRPHTRVKTSIGRRSLPVLATIIPVVAIVSGLPTARRS